MQMSVPFVEVHIGTPDEVSSQPGRCVRTFLFGPFMLQPERQLLLKLHKPIRIGGRALDLLTRLAERAGEVVSKPELLACGWPNTCVDEANLKVNIASLRRILGESADAPRFIATVNGRGYRFVAPVDMRGIVVALSPFERDQPDVAIDERDERLGPRPLDGPW